MNFNILSLFDGMSCGQIALNRAGIKYDKYFASEVDKYAIQVTQANYPNTIQIGDVCKVKGSDLPKIDLLIGGSPCQGFSFAGKQLNFDDPRSKLFFEFIRLLKECKPKYFLLENVIMKKECQNIISSYLNTEPIKINSALVSAQNRRRLYWTNIPNIKQPEDRGISLKDILEDDSKMMYEIVSYENIKDRLLPPNKRNVLLNINPTGRGHSGPVYSIATAKSPPLTASGSNWIKYGEIYSDNKGFKSLKWRQLTVLEWEKLQTVPVNYTSGLPNGQRCKMLGNGWTVEVIAHIFKNLKSNPSPKIDKPCSLIPWHELDIAIEEEK